MDKIVIPIMLCTAIFSMMTFCMAESANNRGRIGNVEYSAKEGNELPKEGMTGEDETILKKRLALNGADYITMTKLGIIYQNRSDRKTALKFFKKAVNIAPDYSLAHLYLGRLYFLMRKNEKAVSELSLFREKMGLLPNMDGDTRKMYIDGLYYLSDVYFTLKRYDEARREIDRILEMDPKQQDAYYNLGVYYYVYEHSRSKAYQSFMKAIDIDSTSYTAKDSRYAIEFIRNNPDPRVIPDFSFIDREYKS